MMQQKLEIEWCNRDNVNKSRSWGIEVIRCILTIEVIRYIVIVEDSDSIDSLIDFKDVVIPQGVGGTP